MAAASPLISLVTPFAAIAQDYMFAEGFSRDQYACLMLSNGMRTAIFSLIGFLAFIAMKRLIVVPNSMQTSNKTSVWLFTVTFALVFYGVGASFFESFVNYPTWRLIGANEFRAYHQALSPLVIGYMVIPMLIGTILTILLLWFRPAPVPRWAIGLAVVLQLIIWISTATIQLPIQMQLSANGLSLPLIDRLIFTNWWLRKVPQIINALLFLWLMSLLLRVNSQRRAEG